MTICSPPLLERIFTARLGLPAHAGQVVEAPVDLIMAHDATMALMVDDFERLGCPMHDSSRVVITCDHFAPPARSDWADLQKQVMRFCERNGIGDVRIYQGICHQLLLEDERVLPGRIVVGADSHTTLLGAVGAFATGLGATDILAALLTGSTWFRIPESFRIRCTGKRQPWVMGRDIALHLLRYFGESGANYRALELKDDTEDGLSMDDRAAICCMAPEMGAKAAIFAPDAVTEEYLRGRDPGYLNDSFWDDRGGAGLFDLEIDVGMLPSLLARPHSPADVVPVSGARGQRIDQIYIGSCAGGRVEDFAIAARIFAGRMVARGVKAIAVPSSVRIFKTVIELGYVQTLLDAGVCVSNPSCGACGGIDKGVLASGDVALMTSTRNFQGRLGPRDSAVYLASTATCAASAITGVITDPREVF